jgi:acyl-CoA synthetase (AMP-forming)/AMP-acid ligase II
VLYRTVGRPQAGTQVEIRDEAGVPVQDGAIGRIYVHGPCVMRGYWRDQERTAEVLTADGWLASSDLGHRDPEGNLVLAGRLSDMYIRGGYNVHPLQVEQVLAEHPAVSEAAVVGAPAAVLGEIGVAFVVPSPDAPPPTLDELRAWCKDRLADYKRPDRLVLVDALPLTSMMKIDKAALSARL